MPKPNNNDPAPAMPGTAWFDEAPAPAGLDTHPPELPPDVADAVRAVENAIAYMDGYCRGLRFRQAELRAAQGGVLYYDLGDLRVRLTG